MVASGKLVTACKCCCLQFMQDIPDVGPYGRHQGQMNKLTKCDKVLPGQELLIYDGENSISFVSQTVMTRKVVHELCNQQKVGQQHTWNLYRIESSQVLSCLR